MKVKSERKVMRDWLVKWMEAKRLIWLQIKLQARQTTAEKESEWVENIVSTKRWNNTRRLRSTSVNTCKANEYKFIYTWGHSHSLDGYTQTLWQYAPCTHTVMRTNFLQQTVACSQLNMMKWIWLISRNRNSITLYVALFQSPSLFPFFSYTTPYHPAPPPLIPPSSFILLSLLFISALCSYSSPLHLSYSLKHILRQTVEQSDAQMPRSDLRSEL